MKPISYHKQFESVVSSVQDAERAGHRKPSLLLHACCGPCSSHVLELLAQTFAVTVHYYNPNIHPRDEYERRLEELKKFLARFPDAVRNGVRLVVDGYDPEDFFAATRVREEPALQTEPEKGERCRRCYEFRMKRAFAYACAHGFDWFTTTLSISPHKDAEKINAIGLLLESEAGRIAAMQENEAAAIGLPPAHTRYLPADFKKRGGFLRSTQLSDEYGLWRQDYCGCVFSRRRGD